MSLFERVGLFALVGFVIPFGIWGVVAAFAWALRNIGEAMRGVDDR